ncbi:MAG: phosphoribosylamine--glycine ligase [Gomphosphaeria aponina SAG 52.96 = DSM 107014]|uniref:Phosphoribosylamine--glycine ligase n=1 Tax=Gomphosphaeria aponina SAG 52.96 = DSM 107014 TaxID=1521640 RepID=A0A941GWP5_9CHRO|nr:phosphoribosylamine--glycine ligase [Gomphosphaeria aponina SAG 52.96 = DSM 107014]
MKVLVVGNGGREHALAWKLLQSPYVEQVICTPGNGGTAMLANCYNLPLAVDDFAGIAQAALSQGVSLVVVGPEVPLSLGIADYLQQYNIKVFGPTRAGAQIEASKSWAKALMAEARVPTAKYQTFTDVAAAKSYIAAEGAPIVIKADALAAGKGVIVASTLEEAYAAVESLWQQGLTTVVLEEFLEGEEVSLLALTDGMNFCSLLPAVDHKRIGEGDRGLNTGGMGAYAPAPLVTPELLTRINKEIIEPTVATLRRRGIDYRGVLYAGLMISREGNLQVLEYNCRFGDPEIQAILPLLKTPLDELLLACVEQKLGDLLPIQWHRGSCVCVVMAAGGYPGAYVKGKEIKYLEKAEKLGSVVFQGGTKIEGEELVTDGGRVLGVTAVGEEMKEAIAAVYRGVECIEFEGMYYRRDIGYRGLNRTSTLHQSSYKETSL